MKPGRFTAVVVCLFACAPVWAGMRPSPQIAVYYDFDQAPPPASLVAMENEVARIMHPAGLSFVWRDLAERTAEEVFSDLVVIRFHGNCNASAPIPREPIRPGASLGDTTVVDGHVLPFSDIACDQLRDYIAPAAGATPEPDAALGRAMGRVVAHEMYHIFAETEKHGSGGVARAYHKRRELLASEFAFDSRETRILRDYARRSNSFN